MPEFRESASPLQSARIPPIAARATPNQEVGWRRRSLPPILARGHTGRGGILYLPRGELRPKAWGRGGFSLGRSSLAFRSSPVEKFGLRNGKRTLLRGRTRTLFRYCAQTGRPVVNWGARPLPPIPRPAEAPRKGGDAPQTQ